MNILWNVHLCDHMSSLQFVPHEPIWVNMGKYVPIYANKCQYGSIRTSGRPPKLFVYSSSQNSRSHPYATESSLGCFKVALVIVIICFTFLTFCSFWYAAYFEIFDIFVANFVVLGANVAYFGICGLFCFTALSPTSTCSPEILHFWRAAWNTEDPDSRSNEKGKTKFYIHGGRWISDDKVLDCWYFGPVWNPHIHPSPTFVCINCP